MRELIISATLVVTLAALGFMGLDRVGLNADATQVSAAALDPVQGVSSSLQPLALHVRYAPESHFSLLYDPARWHALDYARLTTLEHDQFGGCRLVLESDGEPMRVSGQWKQAQRTLGTHSMAIGTVTPDGSSVPGQVVYMTNQQNTYLVFTLTVNTGSTNFEQFQACQADAESVLATLR